ncbi:hypothetical protein DSO57_1036145 [Entomophthora muscae]|uniref:Uncharacterized protein n=1 Tax=Entomophthora muscae TaxID=34485 RepID=A0ACC2U8C6_9FUNG|nr:hypothetical protein DSO57_1036145 [Entomophthora muscae]
MGKLHLYLILVAAAEKSVRVANKVLTMEQLHPFTQLSVYPTTSIANFIPSLLPNVKAPNRMAWVCAGNLEAELTRYRQEHFQDVATEPITRVVLYFFPRGRNITGGFKCHKKVECTITAL